MSESEFPKCHCSSGEAYPFCCGSENSAEFVENDCATCHWFNLEHWMNKSPEKTEPKDFAKV